MKTYISIIRGINVSGKNLIKMKSLHELYVGLGFEQVTTFIQSGNVVFRNQEMMTEELEQLISDEITKQFNLVAPVFVRELADFEIIIAQNPFCEICKEDEGNSLAYLYITFLAQTPVKILLEAIELYSFLPDQFIIKGREVYLFCPGGYGKTKLDNTFFETKLKVKATTRNLRTLTSLVKIAWQTESESADSGN